MDPFFQARNRYGARSYLEDVNRTYTKLPERNNESFQRAMQFREREKAQLDAIAQENEDLRTSLSQYESMATQATRLLESQNASINLLKSKLKKVDGGLSRSDSSHGRNGVPPVQESDNRSARGVAPDVQPEVLPADLPSVGGQGIEHTDAERSPTDDGIGEQPTGGRVSTS